MVYYIFWILDKRFLNTKGLSFRGWMMLSICFAWVGLQEASSSERVTAREFLRFSKFDNNWSAVRCEEQHKHKWKVQSWSFESDWGFECQMCMGTLVNPGWETSLRGCTNNCLFIMLCKTKCELTAKQIEWLMGWKRIFTNGEEIGMTWGGVDEAGHVKIAKSVAACIRFALNGTVWNVLSCEKWRGCIVIIRFLRDS